MILHNLPKCIFTTLTSYYNIHNKISDHFKTDLQIMYLKYFLIGVWDKYKTSQTPNKRIMSLYQIMICLLWKPILRVTNSMRLIIIIPQLNVNRFVQIIQPIDMDEGVKIKIT